MHSPAAELRPLAADWDLLALHRLHSRRYPHLLQSASRGGEHARYDILFAFPERWVSGPATRFLPRLDAACGLTLDERPADGGAPFRGGWFLYLAYELAYAIEPVLGLPPAHPWGWETAWAQYMPAAIVHDHLRGERYAVSAPGRDDLLHLIETDAALAAALEVVDPAHQPLVKHLHEEAPPRYLEGVERIRDYIREGDVFQANLSRAWQGELTDDVDAAALYAALREANPAPFAGLATWGERAVISSSPERLIEADAGHVSTRPIAGTHPRGRDAALDAGLRADLLAHPKEQAEHIMLIDLERNDLGRIARTGTVKVDELMVCESYAHVHHIVSNIRAQLRPGVTPGELIRAVFPGGTITGCPKVRCMQILRTLEKAARGAYTGAMGYLSQHGRMDLNILIRTLETDAGRLRFRTGAGIVADSDPGRELDETRHKAEGLLRALQ
ncbi:aminodeoxychorismate synthase component I [Acidihalobacter ferrooxydans]|uniref:Aminodeoxychorismate synthase, component I n=1 Tax=Acidihalobacter ferrooxydans TaxID=1765967 RepID=A0A1P8ULI2_9GAMM|nr:aminodeoxychorismate synthase component I [Acidihalobacter ferrooxydans]APZ44689.1 aminodeoxychorismate synthase, component I [Acidihalobacter ferrooxydans]